MPKRRRGAAAENNNGDTELHTSRSSTIVDKFDAMKDNNLSEKTKSTYGSKINVFRRFLQSLDPSDRKWYADNEITYQSFVRDDGE